MAQMLGILVLLTEKDIDLLRCILKLRPQVYENCLKCACESDCIEDDHEGLKDGLCEKLGL